MVIKIPRIPTGLQADFEKCSFFSADCMKGSPFKITCRIKQS